MVDDIGDEIYDRNRIMSTICVENECTELKWNSDSSFLSKSSVRRDRDNEPSERTSNFMSHDMTTGRYCPEVSF
ncbi:hypothetical protein VTN49DRAFT_7632 [Thermomyces lanuginosus]|uniref:uncharacterized protein n=1 Tax=Thermomyces lanuginosus TaxID=5541 RepID=UPI0037434C32